jgi:hypothetical protein
LKGRLGEAFIMLGIEGFWVLLAYLCCVLSTILCVVYGAIMWRKGDGGEEEAKEAQWTEEEIEVERSMP